jgi:hypothetical protein
MHVAPVMVRDCRDRSCADDVRADQAPLAVEEVELRHTWRPFLALDGQCGSTEQYRERGIL